MAKGKATFYPGKLQQPVTTNFTDDCRNALSSYEGISGASRSDLLEHSLRKMAGLPVNEDLERMIISASKPSVPSVTEVSA